MGCGPQNPRRIIHIAIRLNVDRQPSVLAIRESCADRGRSVITDATASLAADVVIVLVHIPQSAWPTADETLPSYKRPIFIFDQRPQLGSQTRQADRAR